MPSGRVQISQRVLINSMPGTEVTELRKKGNIDDTKRKERERPREGERQGGKDGERERESARASQRFYQGVMELSEGVELRQARTQNAEPTGHSVDY